MVADLGVPVFGSTGFTARMKAADTKWTRNLAWRRTVIVDEDLGVPVRGFGHWVHGVEYLSVLWFDELGKLGSRLHDGNVTENVSGTNTETSTEASTTET